MKQVILFFSLAFLLFSCFGKKDDVIIDKAKEQQAVMKVIEDYHRGSEKASFYEIEETLADNVIFYGTDSAETIKSRAEFKKIIESQWKRYMLKYGKIDDKVIVMDEKATVASVIYGVPVDIIMDGNTYHVYTRVAKTLKKENHKWLIASGTVGIVGTSQEYANFLSKISGAPTDNKSEPAKEEQTKEEPKKEEAKK